MNPDWLYGLIGGLMIGSAAALLLLGTGRIAGISGILGGALAGSNLAEGAAVLAGLIGASALYALTLGAPVVTVSGSVPLLAAGGLLVGFGSRLGGGCTSGHGVCGMSRLSPRSLVATGTFMAVAAATVFVTRHLIGGN
jgi:uncharacterized membrane protein YedE/YeeE